MSQERMSKSGDRAVTGGGLSTSTAPNLANVLSRTSKALDKVRVVHGANEQYFDHLNGKNVGNVRKSLREVFNIPSDAEAIVDGKQVGDDFILASGQNLEFSKESGTKGVD